MDDIAELEGRITRALDRIRAGVEGLAATAATVAPPDPAPAAAAGTAFAMDAEAVAAAEAAREALELRLEEEKRASAALELRVAKLKERQDERIAGLEAALKEGRERLVSLGEEMDRLKQINAELRAVAASLREAMTRDVAEAHLVNKAMLAEIDSLKTLREVEVAEIDAVIAELRPLAEERG
jgi:SMC interacting uncharacterized protein involved in chromosome segregation